MKRTYTIYKVFDGDTEVFEGDALDVAEKFNIVQKSVYRYLHYDLKIGGRYSIEATDRKRTRGISPVKVKVEKPKSKEIDLLKDHLAFLKHHLKLYGNTVVSFDPVPYFPDLYEAGYNCTVKEIPEVTLSTVSKRGRKPKPKYHYYVEVANYV